MFVVTLVDKLKISICLQNQGHDNLESIFGERLAHAHSFTTEEWSEAHGMMLCLRLFKSLRSVNIVISSPLILVVMKLIDVYHDDVVGLNSDALNFLRLS